METLILFAPSAVLCAIIAMAVWEDRAPRRRASWTGLPLRSDRPGRAARAQEQRVRPPSSERRRDGAADLGRPATAAGAGGGARVNAAEPTAVRAVAGTRGS